MPPQTGPKPNLLTLMKPYRGILWLLVLCTLLANGGNLVVPKIIERGIDGFVSGNLGIDRMVIEFSVVAILIFIFTYLQTVLQTYTAERVARDLRTRLANKISHQAYAFIDKEGPAKLLTNLTSDADAVKNFFSQGIASVISSIFLIIGASILLFITNWKLALLVLSIVPIIGIAFSIIFSKVKKLFIRAQATIDWLNKVINESILGAALIRLVNAEGYEYQKFLKANTEAKDVSVSILNLFASLIPIITFFTNLATLAILMLGGHYVIMGTMTLGAFTAFNTYLAILIFPIIIIGFTSTVIAQATASYGRMLAVIDAPDAKDEGTITLPLSGSVAVKDVTLTYGEKSTLKDITFEAKPSTRTAIIGPTAAGKTQLLSVLTGLIAPTTGEVLYDGRKIEEYNKEKLYAQIGFVFQDSIMFNLSLRENIAFGGTVNEVGLMKAIETAELSDFIDALPHGLETFVSERGTSLSGGQKQRVMLARALALNPKILLLDDFTARVDTRTEKKILENIKNNYPDITLISVTQKIASVEDYDQIIVLMEGEVIARGKHKELLETSPEYVQMYQSQESTEHLT
ncbi:MAG: ABC transporter ATP-binding protein [Candidatus Pacebacteria bacterium]|nr:ABC transporter ATP-binding protein [Candidatus Paceibacterota bacterium]